VDPLLDRVHAGESVDLVEDAIHRIPAQVISGMLGLEGSGVGDRFRDWINGMIGVMNASVEADPERRREMHERGARAQEEILAFCGEILELRRNDPDARDLIRMIAVSDVGTPPDDPSDPRYGADPSYMEERDLQAQIAQLVIAAQDNTANMMSAAVLYLGRYPEVRQALIEDPELLSPTIEELLRHHGSIMVTPRLVRPGGAELEGVQLPEGARVWVLNGAANRDPSRWEDPDRFDIRRELLGNVAFGFGVHNCIGMNLARLELRTFITHLLERVPSYELADDEIDYGSVFFTRGPQRVTIRVKEGRR
jgi:cytochrome P450